MKLFSLLFLISTLNSLVMADDFESKMVIPADELKDYRVIQGGGPNYSTVAARMIQMQLFDDCPRPIVTGSDLFKKPPPTEYTFTVISENCKIQLKSGPDCPAGFAAKNFPTYTPDRGYTDEFKVGVDKYKVCKKLENQGLPAKSGGKKS